VSPARSCEIAVRATPRSSRNRVEVVEGRVKVWVTAAPTDGQANAAVSELVARTLGVPKTSVTVTRGHTAREKVLTVQGIDLEEAMSRFADA